MPPLRLITVKCTSYPGAETLEARDCFCATSVHGRTGVVSRGNPVLLQKSCHKAQLAENNCSIVLIVHYGLQSESLCGWTSKMGLLLP